MNPGDLSWAPFEALGHLTVYPRTSAEQIIERAGEAEILLINKTRLTASVLQNLPHLRFVCVTATGYNVVDTAEAKQRGIVVSNAPAYSTMSVAQTVFAHLLNLTNHTAHYAADVSRGRWTESPDFSYQDRTTIELDGKTLGIVGLGHIGMAVARIAYMFGMKVSAFTSKHPWQLPRFIEKKRLENLLGTSDIVTLHCPQTAETTHLINDATLRQMKHGAILINTARGGLVDDQAVARNLAEGHLAAYAADVITDEPPRADNPLLHAPHAFFTPHIAWATAEARQRLMKICLDNVKAFLDGQPVNVVNA